RRGYELLDPLVPQHVAEVGVPELRRANALLLLFDAASDLERDPERPLEILVGDARVCGWPQELQQPADRLVHGVDVAPAHRAAELVPTLNGREPGRPAELRHALGPEIRY